MASDKQSKIDIPDSIESYSVTLFWGLTMKQVVLVFIATLFTGLAVFSLVSKNYLPTLGMLSMAALTLLAMVEVKGRNFYRYIAFIIAYYRSKPKVLIYNHYSTSGMATIKAKQLVYQQESNYKLFIILATSILLGIAILLLISIYLYHVVHK